MRARRSRARERGFGHVTAMLEAAAVTSWFVVMVLGEKLVGDATLARRVVETSAANAATTTDAHDCDGQGSVSVALGDVAATASKDVSTDGAPDPAAFLSIVQSLGVGSSPTLLVHSAPFHAVLGRAETTGAAAPAPFVGGAPTFVGERKLACTEASADSPETSISTYSRSIFDAHIRGW